MTHLTPEDLTETYYKHSHPEHLDDCPQCQASFEQLKQVLDAMNDYPVPERGPNYGTELWARLLPRLPSAKRRSPWFRWWTLTPVLATLVAVAFLAGMFTQQRRTTDAYAKARQRVLLIAMSRHLERSQIVLEQIANATPATIDLAQESSLARELLNENRLLRQSARQDGDTRDALLLDELERVLLDIANAPPSLPVADLASLQNRIESEGLLFKVRITSSDARFKGQKL